MFEINSEESNPFLQFEAWIHEAASQMIPEWEAMALATASIDAHPSVRMVLYKGHASQNIFFYTNYDSRKAEDLDSNPFAAATFFWPSVGRQIRIEGRVERTSREQSENYFHSRPRDSQLASMASAQSSVISGRQELEQHFFALKKKYQNEEVIPCPKNWGGYKISPQRFEFWKAGDHRLHDRLCYLLTDKNWQRSWLSP